MTVSEGWDVIVEETRCMIEVPRFLPQGFAARTMYLSYSSGTEEVLSEKAEGWINKVQDSKN